MDFRFEDFTEQGYVDALNLAKANWQFESFGTSSTCPHVLWRHDIDVSPHRAVRLAQLESEHGVKATHFFLLHSEFYSCMERSVRDRMRLIANLGHDIGLHFDVSFYPEISDLCSLEEKVKSEAVIVSDLANKEVVAISFHNPTVEHLRFDQPRIAGLANAYSGYGARCVDSKGHMSFGGYQYVADSVGYWRFARLHDILQCPSNQKIQVLTHPEWWTPDMLCPRARIDRAIRGRANRQ